MIPRKLAPFSCLFFLAGWQVHIGSAAPCDVLTEAIFNLVAPSAATPYSYSGFCTAVSNWNAANSGNQIFQGSTEMQQRHELAAFLGNTLHESDDFQAAREYLMCADNMESGGVVYCKPCDSSNFVWGPNTCSVSLVSSTSSIGTYCSASVTPLTNPDGCNCQAELEDPSFSGYVRADKLFFGRGSIQLSHNYNYIDASVALTGSASTFCDNPDLVATNEAYAWGVGIYFWMSHVDSAGRTSHTSVLTNGDFGGTLFNINGGLECPGSGWHADAVKSRLNRYCLAATELGVDMLLTLDNCNGLQTAFDECTAPGASPACADCVVWTQSAPPTKSPTKAPTAPTTSPTKAPTAPTTSPTKAPTTSPVKPPTKAPTTSPTKLPTKNPTKSPTGSPTAPTTSPTGSPTAPTTSPTTTPTKAPVSSANPYYPNWGGTEHICVNDGAQPNYMTQNPTVYLHPTLASCCQQFYSWNYDDCAGGGVTTTQAPPTGRYYPDWSGSNEGCLNDGNEPDYMKANPTAFMYETLELCCSNRYGWMMSTCMGTAQTSSSKWYVDYGRYICKQDCVGSAPCGGAPASWKTLYNTVADCCREKLFWITSTACHAASELG